VNWRRQTSPRTSRRREVNVTVALSIKLSPKTKLNAFRYRKCIEKSTETIKKVARYVFARNREIYRGIRQLKVRIGHFATRESIVVKLAARRYRCNSCHRNVNLDLILDRNNDTGEIGGVSAPKAQESDKRLVGVQVESRRNRGIRHKIGNG